MKRLAVLSTLLVLLLALGAAGAASASATEPPALGSFSISPGTVNITSSAQNVTVSAEITSSVGVASASAAFESPHGKQSTGSVSFTKVSGTATKGIWEATVPFKQYSADGTWGVSSVNLADTEGNQVRLSATQLAEKSFPSTVTVEGTEDNEVPIVTALSFSSPSLNISSSAQTLTVKATITDNLSGLTTATIGFRSPQGRFTTGHATLTKVSGTSTSGTYEAVVTFPRYAEVGIWNVSTFQLIDNVGNESALTPTRLEAKGFPGNVIVEGTEDAGPPEVSAMTFEPSAVEVSSSAQTVTVKATLTDSLSGVAAGAIQFESPSGKQFTSKVAFSKVSGTETSGTWEAKVPFEKFIQSGSWKVTTLLLEDNVGNVAKLTSANLEGKGLPHSVAVTSTEDTEAPKLASFTLTPSSVNTTTSAQTVTATAEITDNASGFAHGSLDFKKPTGEHLTVPMSFVRVSGTATKGVYEAKTSFNRYTQSGTWSIGLMNLGDAVGNEVNFTAAELEAKSLPHSVSVTDSSEDTEAPHPTAFAISPTTINTVAHKAIVTIKATLADNLSGLAAATVVFEGPNRKRLSAVAKFARLSGTELSGTYEAVIAFKVSEESGTWRVRGLSMEDAVENLVSLNAAELEGKGFPATFVDETESPPTIKKMSPRKGPAAGGTEVTILGTNFAGATEVKFGGAPAASFKVNSEASITAVTPAETSGKVNVTITTPHGTNAITGKGAFKFGAPTISSISPEAGPHTGGTKVTITGSGYALGAGTTFKFGSAMATSVNCTTSTSCTMFTPAVERPLLLKVVAQVIGGKHSKASEASFDYT
jgi:IPT/TIG domain